MLSPDQMFKSLLRALRSSRCRGHVGSSAAHEQTPSPSVAWGALHGTE